MITYDALSELAECAAKQKKSIGQLVLQDQALQMETTEEALCRIMDERLAVMVQSAEKGMASTLQSNSGLTGGEGSKMKAWAEENNTVSGPFCARAMTIALAVAGCNAAMGKIVASPTAGSCGILPGALLAAKEQKTFSQEELRSALFCASGIGLVIAKKASISGAEGGCQAECGSAAAMAAAAVTELWGGSPEAAVHAAAMAIKNQMGLVCDPVAGLVEVPCIKRNAGGVMIAIGAADMALAGIRSVIPPDEVIQAMKSVGESIPCALRETARGGLAETPTGIRIAAGLFGKEPF